MELVLLGQSLYRLDQYEYPVVETFIQQGPLTIEEKVIKTFPEEPHNMLAIARCESGLNQAAVSHTRDFGIMQINEYAWDATANEMGLDYKGSVDDNLEMARHIYEVSGKNAWVCWTKYLI